MCVAQNKHECAAATSGRAILGAFCVHAVCLFIPSMLARSAQGLTYRFLSRISPAGCHFDAAACENHKREAPSTANPDASTDPKAHGIIKITQRIGLYDYTAEYKQGELKWCTTDKHEDPAQSEDDSATAKRSVLAWIQRRYRCESCSRVHIACPLAGTCADEEHAGTVCQLC